MTTINPDNLLDLIQTRRSIRSFDPSKKPTDEQIQKILEAGRWAPSAGNVQDWRFFVVRDRQTIEKLNQAKGGRCAITDLSVVIAVAANLEVIGEAYGERGQKMYAFQDSAAAIQNMLLMAHALGLGACWMSAFDDQKVARALGLEKNWRPMALIPIGFMAESPDPVERKNLEEIVRYL